MMCSCYSDKSTMRTIAYPEIVINPSEKADTLTVSYGDRLSIRATAIQSGVPDSDLEYLWEMDMAANKTNGRAFLSDTPDVDFTVAQPASDIPYTLSLTVTNRQTGYLKVRHWSIYVTSTLGEGLLVGHTRDGGKTSELDLICSPAVTYGYTSAAPHVTRDALGIIGEEKLEGRISAMEYSVLTDMSASTVKSYNEPLLSIATDRHFYVVDPTTYTLKRRDGACFMGYTADRYDVDFVKNAGAVSCQVLCNSKLMTVSSLMDNTFAVVSSPMQGGVGFTPKNFCSVTQKQGDVYAFDEVKKVFYTQRCWCLHQSALSTMVGSIAPTPDFLADKTSVACGEFNGMSGIYILKGKSDDYHAVVLCAVNSRDAEIYDLTLPEVDKAVSFAFCDNAGIFYYATPDKIYSSLLTSGKFNTRALTWKPDSPAEKITGICQYLQGWYGNHDYDAATYDFVLNTNRLQMIITTYNASTGEGKVYLRPFNVATGMFTYKDNGVFDGFGEITSVTSTMR